MGINSKLKDILQMKQFLAAILCQNGEEQSGKERKGSVRRCEVSLSGQRDIVLVFVSKHHR